MVIAVAMVPAQAEIYLELVPVVVIEVGSQHLSGVQSSAVPPSGILLFVVGIAQECKARLVGKMAAHAA